MAALMLTGAFAVAACDNGKEPVLPPEDKKTVVVTANEENVEIKDTAVAGYDYTSLFSITVDGAPVSVLASYIDSTEVKAEAGEYTVKCTYEEKSASVGVTVVATAYEVTLSVESITLKAEEVAAYDFKSLFTATKDGEAVEITDEMITSDVKAEAGTYSYTVKYGTAGKTLAVTVTEEAKILIVPAYKSFEIPVNELEGFDFTSLFSLYADGAAVRVTAEMLDIPSLENEGDSGEVTLSYTFENETESKSVSVKIVGEVPVAVNAKNIVTYPNGDNIDLTTLFEISKGGVSIPVTDEMISGSIDYSTVGVNEITLSYGGKTYTATVEIKRGVVISLPKGDTIAVRRGTDKTTYNFANDFSVLINGIKFTALEPYIDVSEADFSTVGEYAVKISVPYNDKNFGLSGVNFTYTDATITYKVVANNYSVVLGKELVTLPRGTESYKITGNLTVTINGRTQQLVENKDWVDSIACYYEVLSDPIDFTAQGKQEVRVAIYVNGVDAEPHIATYFVEMESDITVTSTDAAVFSNSTFYATDLFKITEGDKEVEVTFDMISGKVDTFNPGVYAVAVDYKGIVGEAKVVVFDSSLLGTYHTNMTPIPAPAEDEENDDSYGDGTSPYSLNRNHLGDMIITEDGITVNGVVATDVSGLDGDTMTLKLAGNNYTLCFENGIAVLVPLNELRLSFNDGKRPLVYFHGDVWTLQDAVTVNYSTDYVLSTTYTSYSIDTFKAAPKAGGEAIWYGLMVNLVEKTSVDTIYAVTWGKAEYAQGFVPKAGVVSSMVFDGTEYSFTMSDDLTAKVNANASLKLYANMNFKGVIDGQTAELRVDRDERYTLVIGSRTVFSSLGSSYDLANIMHNGGANYAERTINLNSFVADSGLFSYKFAVDPENKTFTLLEKDKYFGRYETEGMYLFLDGYGSGLINFNSSSYARTQFAYTVNGNILNIKYQNIKPNFEYGTGATFYIEPLLNVLTAKDMHGFDVGLRFENIEITDGAIVRVGNYVVGAAADELARANLLSQIQIITKDGVLDSAAKSKLVDTGKVRFSTAGYYQFTIKVECAGKEVESYYAVQILEAVYASNPVAATYGSGVINKSYSLTIDKYGRANINCLGTVFSGFAQIADDNTFVIRASNAQSGFVTATGELIADGIVKFGCSGAATFFEYFTTGTSRVTGTAGLVLRQITADGVSTFIKCTSATSLGTVVTVTGDVDTAGSTITITDKDTSITAKIISWNNTENGLQIL